jgi:YfiH family protein
MHRLEHANGVITYAFELFQDYPVHVHVSTRHGGVSPAPWNTLNFSVKRGDTRERVRANRERLAAALALDVADFVACQQVHGQLVAPVDRAQSGTVLEDADGLTTANERLPLSLVFADCVPVVLYDRRRHALGTCHAGWRGTVQGVVDATLSTMVDHYGSDPADIVAGIGPSIGPASYEVGDDVVSAVHEKLPEPELLLIYGNGAKPHFDLWEANRRQLLRCGVPAEQIEVSGVDTATNTTDFFSHRAEHGQCGLFSMVAWLEPRL